MAKTNRFVAQFIAQIAALVSSSAAEDERTKFEVVAELVKQHEQLALKWASFMQITQQFETEAHVAENIFRANPTMQNARDCIAARLAKKEWDELFYRGAIAAQATSGEGFRSEWLAKHSGAGEAIAEALDVVIARVKPKVEETEREHAQRIERLGLPPEELDGVPEVRAVRSELSSLECVKATALSHPQQFLECAKIALRWFKAKPVESEG